MPISDLWDCVTAVFRPRPHWSAWLEPFDYGDGILHIPFRGVPVERLETAFRELEAEFNQPGSLRDDLCLHAVEKILLIVRSYTHKDEPSSDQRVNEALAYIHANMSKELSVESVAQAVGLSDSRLSTLFSAVMGAPPRLYLERVRLDRAAEMLRFTSRSIGEIAQSVGFTEQNYFARRFRLLYGLSPREYRIQSHEQA